MQTLLKHWADALLEWLGLASAQDSGWDRWVAFTLVLLAVALFDFCMVASICSRWRLKAASRRPSSSRPRGTRIFIGSTKWPLMITS